MTQKDKMLALFKERGGSIMTSDIPHELCFEYRRVICELRNELAGQGKTIEAKKVTRNNWRYTIIQTSEANGQYVFGMQI